MDVDDPGNRVTFPANTAIIYEGPLTSIEPNRLYVPNRMQPDFLPLKGKKSSRIRFLLQTRADTIHFPDYHGKRAQY